MPQDLFFCRSWQRASKSASQDWPVEMARLAHAARQPYTVLVGSRARPECVLEIASRFVGIFFLDRLRRERLNYWFQEFAPSELFLSSANYHRFVGDGDALALSLSCSFSRQGEAHARRRQRLPSPGFDSYRCRFDVSSHYDTFPAFGNYASLIRRDRG